MWMNREEIEANYADLMASGFFTARAIKSKRHPGTHAQSQAHMSPPQWPLRAYAEHGLDRVGKRIHELLDHTARMTPEGYRAALASREGLRRQVEALRARADGFLALCSSGPAIVGHDYTGSRSYPTPWTLVAGPAFALPLLAADGLPLGLQLAGFRDRDAEACGVARWIRDLLLPDSL